MRVLETITGATVAANMRTVVERNLPLTITILRQGRWLAFRSKALATKDGQLYLEVPVSTDDLKAVEVLAGQPCAMDFRLGIHLSFFNGVLTGPEKYVSQTGEETSAFVTPLPESLDRVERRAFERVDVPSDRVVRGRVWVANSQKPIWAGDVLNISISGFQLRTVKTAMVFFEPEDIISSAISFEGEPLLQFDAHYRHGVMDGEMAMLGLEFVISPSSAQDRASLAVVAAKVEEYKKLAKR